MAVIPPAIRDDPNEKKAKIVDRIVVAISTALQATSLS